MDPNKVQTAAEAVEEFDAAFAEIVDAKTDPAAADDKEEADPVTPPTKDPDPVTPPTKDPNPAPANDQQEEDAIAKALATIHTPKMSDEHVAKLEEMKKNWPDIFEAFEVARAHERAEITADVARSLVHLGGRVDQLIEPLSKAQLNSAYNQHMAEVRGAIPDFDIIRDLVPDWIKTQPAYVQGALKNVYDKGNVADTVALFNDFKKSTGRSSQPKVPDTPDPKKESQEDASLTPVKSKATRPAPAGQVDKQDFDAAWEEAVQQR